MRFIPKPLSRLFTAPPTPAPAPDPLTALDSGSAELINATALGDGDETLRAAAIRKLTDGEPLRRLAGLGDAASPAFPSILERAAQERMAQLIDARMIDFEALCAVPRQLPTVLAVAGFCSDPQHLARAFSRLDDAREITRLVTEGSSSRLRQLAAQRIEDPAELRQLIKQVRGRDKSVYKIIQQKFDVQRAEEEKIAAIEADVADLCESLERHGRGAYDALYVPFLEQLQTRWRAVEEQAAPALRERTRQAVERCREVIAEHARQAALRSAETEHQAALQAAHEESLAQAADQARRRDEEAALAAADAAGIRTEEERAQAERLAGEALALRRLGGLIAKTRGELSDGHTGRAAGLRRAIEEKLPAVPAIPAHLAKQLQALDGKLNELKQWKDYAAAPKRAELIAEMESLIGAALAPKSLAARIKGLQEEWKTVSKGIVSDSEADWQRFHQASAAAYQPCREYFEALARQRQANLEKRKSVLERLQAFESAQSGEHPDYRAVMAVLREAPPEFRRYFPLDRAAGHQVQQEFDASIARLQGRVDAWHAVNAEEKRSLIQRAQFLSTKEDSRETVDAVKRLQLLWKQVPPAARDEEQRLWEEFREQCEAVYQKRQQAHAEYTAALEANQAQAETLCEQAEQAAALAGSALLEAAGKIPQWRAAFEALGEMPRASEHALHDRFERALKACQAQLGAQRARDKDQSFANLFEAAQRIQQFGWAVAQAAAAADRDVLKQAAEAFIAGVEHWPKGAAQALKEAWAKADAAAGLDPVAAEIALRTLCIRSEIIHDASTPSEDQALRRSYQVQRLVERMGQGNDSATDNPDALAMEWVRAAPVAPPLYEILLLRFKSRR